MALWTSIMGYYNGPGSRSPVLTQKCLLVVVVVVCFLAEISSSYFIPPPADNIFRDIQGEFCSRRRGEQCCPGRDDGCYMPIADTICYCDIFCNRTVFDCCPDFWAHCLGSKTDRPPVVPPQPTILNKCIKNGVIQPPGAVIRENCNECKCSGDGDGGSGDPDVGADPDAGAYSWRCTKHACLISPQIIQTVNSGPYSWRSGNYSALWGMTLSDGIKYRLGTLPPDQPVVKMHPIHMHPNEVIPDELDARREWKGMIHGIDNQENCGASWAFSTTAVASDRLAIQSDGMFNRRLSAQHMLSCNTRKQKGCEGGSLDRAWWFLRKTGVVDEECYPYTSGETDKKGQCYIKRGQKHGMCPTGGEYQRDQLYRSTPPYRIAPSEVSIMREIKANGPVQATFKVKEDFYSYKSGVYSYVDVPNSNEDAKQTGYHSIRIIGWGTEITASGRPVKYWLCANSWGVAWGENGYFRILRGENECQIESFVVGAWVKVGNLRFTANRMINSREGRLRHKYRIR